MNEITIQPAAPRLKILPAFRVVDVRPVLRRAALFVLLLVLSSGCSIRRFALNKTADALSKTGSTFASDDDPELIKAAAPFSLKLMESILAETPRHTGLLSATSSGFTQFAYAFVQQDADEIEETNLAAAEAMRDRARKLYLRAQKYGLRGLEVKHPGFSTNLLANPKSTVRSVKKSEVPLLYWTAAAWGSAISLSKNNPELIAQVPAVEALIDRALELDESFNDGAIHTFLISYEMNRQGVSGDPATRSRKHFERAVELSHGKSAAPFVALAEAVTIKKQDAKEFESLLNRALAINPDEDPDTRLLNTIMQRRARWLLSRKSDLFLE
jgi:predicted anti-sigma-YlaC factor YlaD